MLRFQDGAFEDPFLARYVSDETIKMFAYLVFLYDPSPHPFLSVEEPENQLYPDLLGELTEEFRGYSTQGGQVFVSTHSPYFLNATRLEEVFWLVKEDGHTKVIRAQDNQQVKAYIEEGDQMGHLWIIQQVYAIAHALPSCYLIHLCHSSKPVGLWLVLKNFLKQPSL